LGLWVTKQCRLWNACTLSKVRVELLEKIGFVFDMNDKTWQDCYNELKAYKEEHKHCLFPRVCEENVPLRRWVVKQRSLWKARTLSKHRVELLEKIGFVFELDDERWQDCYGKLKAYKEEHKNCLVSNNCNENESLASWVDNQRTLWKAHTLSKVTVGLLEKLALCSSSMMNVGNFAKHS